MTLEKLTEATAAGFDLIAAMLESILPQPVMDAHPDPRLQMLRTLVHELAPVPPPVTACQHCGMPRAEMDWHPNDDHTVCPRCSRFWKQTNNTP